MMQEHLIRRENLRTEINISSVNDSVQEIPKLSIRRRFTSVLQREKFCANMLHYIYITHYILLRFSECWNQIIGCVLTSLIDLQNSCKLTCCFITYFCF